MDSRISRRRWTVGTITTVLGAGLLAVSTSTSAASAPAGTTTGTAEGGCQVVRMSLPDGFYDGGVMDMEQVGDQVVYYGNGFTRNRRGEELQRAFVWRGLDGEPEQVGPTGRWDLVIALELTETGLINGTAESFDGSRYRSWVQNLATGELRFFDHDSGPRGEDHGFTWVRRINDSGAATGTAFRSDDPEGEPGTDAVGFESVEAPMKFLTDPVDYLEAGSFGINDDGYRVGYMAREFLVPEDQFWTIWEPVRWNPDGTETPLATPYGREALPREIEDDGSAAGLLGWGEDPLTAHIEAAYWPTPDAAVALGVLPRGDFSDAFGADAGGYVVGLANQLTRRTPYAPEGFADHSFLWTPEIGEGRMRVLPSLYGARHDLPWRRWIGGAAHAANSELDQAGSTTHVRFGRRGRAFFAPTVFVNASECGREVSTSHELPDLDRRTAQRPAPVLGGTWKRTVLAQR